MANDEWKTISDKAKQILNDSIPSEWRIPKNKLPSDEQLDVTGVPASCGILSEQDLTITDSYADEIVKNIAAGKWKAEDVTRAFCKRAAIAHQLVSPPETAWEVVEAYEFRTGELLDGHDVRRRHRARKEA